MSTDRLRQVPGGWLLAQDLRDQPRLADLRLARHHVAAHRTWGCSTGLEVMAFDGELTVMPGVAVDRCGQVAVLSTTYSTALPPDPVAVVLRAVDGGPAAEVLLRPVGDRHRLDVPLARVSKATVRAGDGDRQWLRRPGPARRLGGTVPRGAAVDGTASTWTASVDLDREQLPDVPAVVATAAGPTPGGVRTTVEVTNVSAAGFDIVVRHLVPTTDVAVGDVIRTAPHALAWLALLPAERPTLPPHQENR